MKSAPHCLLSDCDGVIVDSERIADQIMEEVLEQELRHTGLGPRLRALFGMRVGDIITTVAAECGVKLSAERCRQLQRLIDSRVAQAAPAMPAVVTVFQSLRLPVGIVSNSARHRLERSVQQSGLGPLVGSHMYSADDVAAPKPAPDVYLHAARTMGFAPADCLVIEDSATGVKAARAAGMPVFGFLGGSHVPPGHGQTLLRAGAAAIFERLPELPALLQAQFSGWPRAVGEH